MNFFGTNCKIQHVEYVPPQVDTNHIKKKCQMVNSSSGTKSILLPSRSLIKQEREIYLRRVSVVVVGRPKTNLLLVL
jgi:hypothetical protein